MSRVMQQISFHVNREAAEEKGMIDLLRILEKIVLSAEPNQNFVVSWSTCGKCGCLLYDTDPGCPMCRYQLLNER